MASRIAIQFNAFTYGANFNELSCFGLVGLSAGLRIIQIEGSLFSTTQSYFSPGSNSGRLYFQGIFHAPPMDE